MTTRRDHAGGNEKIKELVPGIKVYGGSIDNVKGCTNKIENGDKVHLGADISVLALHTPWYGYTTCQLRFLLAPCPPCPKGESLYLLHCIVYRLVL